MELINLEHVRGVLEEYAQAVRNLYQDNLIRSDRIASGDLLNSVEYRVIQDGAEYEVQLSLAEYWKHVEYDTKPHWPPVSAIREWIRVKPVLPRPDANGRIPTPQTLAFLIGRAIAGKSPNQEKLKNPQGGTEGSHDLERAIDAINREYRDKLVVALSQDTDTLMKVIVGEIRGSLTQG